MKKASFFALVCALLLALVPAVNAAEPYKIGAVLSLTGRLSFIGDPEKKAIDLIVKQINSQGGINGHPLEIVYYDDETTEMKTVNFVKKVIQKDKVLGIIGPSSSGSTFATVPIAEKAKVPMLSLAGSTSFVYPLDKKRYIFSAGMPANNQIETQLWYLKMKGISKIATLTSSNAFGEAGREWVMKLAPIHGMKIVLQEKFKQGDKDITPQLTRIKASDAQGIISWCAGPTAIILTKNYYSLGIKIPLMADLANATKFFIDRVGQSFEGRRMIVTNAQVADTLPDTDPLKSVAQKFWGPYAKAYGKDPDTFALMGAAALQIYAEALKKSGADRDKLREAIENIQGLPTPLFIASMSSHDHIAAKGGVSIGTIKAGKWVYIPPAQW
ncbi:ABC transporter substrate-binding protein [Thermodesulfobacteriota bacterium]